MSEFYVVTMTYHLYQPPEGTSTKVQCPFDISSKEPEARILVRYCEGPQQDHVCFVAKKHLTKLEGSDQHPNYARARLEKNVDPLTKGTLLWLVSANIERATVSCVSLRDGHCVDVNLRDISCLPDHRSRTRPKHVTTLVGPQHPRRSTIANAGNLAPGEEDIWRTVIKHGYIDTSTINIEEIRKLDFENVYTHYMPKSCHVNETSQVRFDKLYKKHTQAISSHRLLLAILHEMNVRPNGAEWNEIASSTILATPILNGRAARKRFNHLVNGMGLNHIFFKDLPQKREPAKDLEAQPPAKRKKSVGRPTLTDKTNEQDDLQQGTQNKVERLAARRNANTEIMVTEAELDIVKADKAITVLETPTDMSRLSEDQAFVDAVTALLSFKP